MQISIMELPHYEDKIINDPLVTFGKVHNTIISKFRKSMRMESTQQTQFGHQR